MIKKFKLIIFIAVLVSLGILLCGVCLGSSRISVKDTLAVIGTKLHLQSGRSVVKATTTAIVWDLRMPRALLAFIAGAALSVAGAVFQSVLRNPLASPSLLGVSSGASLGAALVMLSGFSLPLAASFSLPLGGFLFGFATVLVVLLFARVLDRAVSNNTIILFGMVFSLFVNAILTLLSAFYRDELKNLLYWEMGSFALKGWKTIGVALPCTALGLLGIVFFCREMDILTFGEEEAQTLGVNTRRLRVWLLFCAALLTGGVTALCGSIGFVDLIAPHIARSLVGSRHSRVLPLAALLGGSLLVLTDLLARTVVSPAELPVGAVTAIIGAPFFAWVYFRR
jgi:iron complex transport system permease protein